MKINMNDMQQLKNDLDILNTQIEIYSMYDKKDIAEVISRLMTSYEGVKYYYKFLYDINNNEKCVIIPVNNDKYSLKLTLSNLYNSQSYQKNSDDKFFLPPSIYSNEKVLKIKYVQDFINFIFNYRNEKNVIELNKSTLNNLLTEYLNNTKLNQFLRQNDKKNYASLKDSEERRIEFEKNCTVSRKAIFECIISILNDYEDNNVTARNQLEEYPHYNDNNETITYSLYDTLFIYRLKKKFKFEVLVTEDTVSKYELEFKNIDYKMDTQINYFKLKEKIQSIFWDCVNLKSFMNGLEVKFKDKQQLEEQDVYDTYLEVINKVKKYYK